MRRRDARIGQENSLKDNIPMRMDNDSRFSDLSSSTIKTGEISDNWNQIWIHMTVH